MSVKDLLLLVAGINFVAAFLQASVGFGYAILAMSLMPLWIPMRICSAVSAVTVVAIGVQMVTMLRSHLRVKTIALPIACCILSTNLGMYMLLTFPERILRVILAVFILLLTLYFVISQKHKIQLQNTRRNGILFGLLTGLSTGMFNIVGPFFMIYYYNISDDNLSFKANMELSFLIAGLYSTALHLYHGTINGESVPYVAVSVAAALVAGFMGIRLYRRLKREIICRVIYIALPVMAFFLLK